MTSWMVADNAKISILQYSGILILTIDIFVEVLCIMRTKITKALILLIIAITIMYKI